MVDNYLAEDCCSNQNVSKMRKKITNDFFPCYAKTASTLLSYLNIVLSSEACEHIYVCYRPVLDYNNESLKDLNAKK